VSKDSVVLSILATEHLCLLAWVMGVGELEGKRLLHNGVSECGTCVGLPRKGLAEPEFLLFQDYRTLDQSDTRLVAHCV
jgi:hypothetical protein